MRVTAKLTIGMMLAVVLVLVFNGILRVQRERDFILSDARKDQRALGLAIAAEVVATWRSEGEAAALEVVELANSAREHVAIGFVGASALEPAIGGTSSEGESHFQQRGAELVTFVPVTVRGTVTGAIQLAESVNVIEEFLRGSILRVTLAAVLALAAAAGIAWLVGLRLVGRPVQRMIEKARRIGRGDFSIPLAVQTRDELGDLAGEVNAMCAQLETALARTEREHQARLVALEQLRRADRLSTLGSLAAGMAHELGTPLNVVEGRAKLIETGRAEGPQAVQNARIIAEQARRMTTLVRQLLDLARPRPARRSSTKLRPIAESAAALLSLMAERRGVGLTVDGDAALTAMADPDQLQQVLTNLVVNAIHASPKGEEVSISVEEMEGLQLRIAVRDRGPGIAADHQERLFEPFFTTKDVGEGTGLGLSVARGLARENGGEIVVESTLGAGACFSLVLPREPMGSTAAGHDVKEPP